MQRREGRRVAVPEPSPGPADVPVGQVVDELRQPTAGAGRVEVLERLVHLDHRARAAPREPTGPSPDAPRRGAKEPGTQPLALAYGQGRTRCSSRSAGPCARPPRAPRRRPGGSATASRRRACTTAVRQRRGSRKLKRVQDVAEVLAHLAAVFVDDVAQAEHRLVRGPLERERAHRHQRVEPATGLVDRLADVVGRVGGLELRVCCGPRAGSRTARRASSPSRTIHR